MKKLTLLLTIFFVALYSNAQNVAINNDGTSAATSAMLDIKSTTKGMLMPRMTTAQRTAIVSPALGLLVFDTDTKTIWAYNGTVWTNLSSVGGGGFTLPYENSAAVASSAFKITNSGTAIEGITNGVSANGIRGIATVNGSNGVYGGSTSSTGVGVRGESNTGTGIIAYSGSGTGLSASSLSGTGIYTNSISGLALNVNGNLKIAGGNTNPSNGAVLTSDASGNAVWKNNNIAFSVTGYPDPNYTNVITIPANSTRTVHLTTEEFDYGNRYAVYVGNSPAFGNSVFVASKTGLYHFDAAVGLESDNGDDIFNVRLTIKIIRVVGGVGSVIYGATTEFSSGMRSIKWMGEARISKDIKLISGDIVELDIINNNNVAYTLNGYAYTEPHFGCHLIFEE